MFKNLPKSRILKQTARLNKIAGADGSENAFKIDSNRFSTIELLLIQKNIHGPSVGLKKFWRHHLPTLKFHNDDINFVMTRIDAKTKDDVKRCPAKVVIHGRKGERFSVNCLGRHSNDILAELVKKTDAQAVPPNEIPVVGHSDAAY